LAQGLIQGELQAAWPQTENAASAKVAVALSGGLDSISLLHACLQAFPGQVVALHVNHHLQEASARFEAFCVSWCAANGAPLTTLHLEAKPSKGESIEAFARRERYRLLEQAALAAGCNTLLTAHHQDDQVETLLLALSRGADIGGISSIAPSRMQGQVRLVRPLLGLRRSVLKDYAKTHGLQWIDDPTNTDQAYKRNALRSEVLPALERILPRFVEQAARSVTRLQARAQAAVVLPAHDAADKQGLSRTQLLAASPETQAIMIRQWLATHGLAMPSQSKMLEIAKQLTANGAYGFVPHQGHMIRRYRDSIELVPERQASSIEYQHKLFDIQALKAGVRWSLGNAQTLVIQAPESIGSALDLGITPIRLRERWRPAQARYSRQIRLWCQAGGIGADLRTTMWGLQVLGAEPSADGQAPWLFIAGLGLSALAADAGWKIALEGSDLY
jgi:tRNA(Ile)-lysidine synthase